MKSFRPAMLIALVSLAALSGCATGRVPFTQSLREQYRLEGENLKRLQYYVVGDITLQRDFRREEGEVSGSHKLVVKEGGLVEEVFIKSGTPGVATEVGATSVGVSFEPGGSIVFGSPPSDRDRERVYKFSASEWNHGYGKLVYGGKTYYALEGSGLAYIEVGMESLDAVEKKTKVLPGMTLPEK